MYEDLSFFLVVWCVLSFRCVRGLDRFQCMHLLCQLYTPYPREGNFCLNWEVYSYRREKVIVCARLYLGIMCSARTPHQFLGSEGIKYGACFYSLLQLQMMQGAAAANKPCCFCILKTVPVFLLYSVPDKRWTTCEQHHPAHALQ